MKAPKGRFIIDLGFEVVDLALIDKADWEKIKKNVKHLIATETCTEVGVAYIAAFLVWVSDRQDLAQPFDPATDKMN